MDKQKDLAILILRLVFGGFMLTHGYDKLNMLLAEEEIKFFNFMGLGPTISLGLTVFAEFFCAILLIIGYKTKLAAAFLLFTMIIAAFVVHGDDPFGKKEMALLYAAAYLSLMISGGGWYSIDRE